MLLSTHKRIAERIATELKLDLHETASFIKGIVRPDYWKDYPHHYGKEDKIRRYILDARRLYLEGKTLDSLYNLGIALHYIQDRWVSLPGWHIQHGVYEDEIDRMPFVDDVTEIIKDIDISVFWKDSPLAKMNPEKFHEILEDSRKRYFAIIERLTRFEHLCRNRFDRLDGKTVESMTLSIALLERPKLGSPIHDFNLAYKVSLLVALSVYMPKISQSLQETLTKLKEEYQKKLEEAEASLARELTNLQRRIDELERKKSFKNKLRKLACKVRMWFKRKEYENRDHLRRVRNAYYREVASLIRMYENWYKVEIPELRVEDVKKRLENLP